MRSHGCDRAVQTFARVSSRFAGMGKKDRETGERAGERQGEREEEARGPKQLAARGRALELRENLVIRSCDTCDTCDTSEVRNNHEG